MNSTGTKDIKKIQDEITAFLSAHGAAQVGFCKAADNEFKLGYAISYTVRLSNAVIDCIDTAPTHTYFHHYRTVNALIDLKLARMRLYARTIRIQICRRSWRHSRSTECRESIRTNAQRSIRVSAAIGKKQPVFIKQIRSESKARN